MFSSTVNGLQTLINKCKGYADLWKMKFGLAKTKCMITGRSKFLNNPIWVLGDDVINNVDHMDILGTTFSDCGTFNLHIESRQTACRRAFYSLQQHGLSYPGLGSFTKSLLFKTCCQPVLFYGCEALNLSNADLQSLDSCQGCLVKHFCGVGKRNRHSALLRALNIGSTHDIIERSTVRLFKRLCNVNSPLQKLLFHCLALYIHNGVLIQGTIVERLVGLGLSPTNVLFFNEGIDCNVVSDGVVDSLRGILVSENFNVRTSAEHLLLDMLTRAF